MSRTHHARGVARLYRMHLRFLRNYGEKYRPAPRLGERPALDARIEEALDDYQNNVVWRSSYPYPSRLDYAFDADPEGW